MKSQFPLKKIGFSAIILLGFCFFAGESLAQSEQEKVDLENVKPTDKPVLEDNGQNSENLVSKSATNKTNFAPNNKVAVKRDLPAGGVEKEIKKEESVPSTLSFNIFLYIVDKFKAD